MTIFLIPSSIKTVFMRRLLFLLQLFILFFHSLLFAQNSSMQLPEHKNAFYKPRIGLGAGVFAFFGEVRDNNFSHLLTGSLGYDLTVSQNISKKFNIEFRALYGNLCVNRREIGKYYNFKSEIWSGSTSLVYNFGNPDKRKKILRPFISMGVGVLSFNSKTDRKDANGNVYHYWRDGSIRNMEQSDPDSLNAIRLERDYVYETDLRSQNLDSLGKYRQFALSFPLSYGLNFNVGNRFGMKLYSTYFFNLTDLIDNISDKGTHSRKGNEKNDNFMNFSVSLSYSLWGDKTVLPDHSPQNKYYENVDFVLIDDMDEDGVSDEDDYCPDSPKGVKVNSIGCPADMDGDGVADYLDKEPLTAHGNIVDKKGVTIPDIDFETLHAWKREYVTDEIAFASEGKKQENKGENYTVHVGTYGRNVPRDIQEKLDSISGIVQTRINDTLTIFTVGSYKNWNQAEARQGELLSQGINDAFGVKENRSIEVTGKIDYLIKNEPELKALYESQLVPDEISFKVQTEEYRGEFDLAKLSGIIAKHGLQIQTTTGGLKIYTLGSFDNFEQADELKKEINRLGIKGVKIASYLNGRAIPVEDALKYKEKK